MLTGVIFVSSLTVSNGSISQWNRNSSVKGNPHESALRKVNGLKGFDPMTAGLPE